MLSMWSSPQKIFPWRSPLKSGSLDSRPVHSPLFKLIITKNQISMWSSPQKIFLRDARLSKSGSLDSRPVTLASIQVDNHEKMLIGMWSSPQKIFPWRSPPLKKWVSTVAPWHSPLFKLIITKKCYSMWSSPQKIFLVTLASQKSGSLDSRPVTLSIQVDNHEKML